MKVKSLIIYLLLMFGFSTCGIDETSMPGPARDQNQLDLPPFLPVLGETSLIEVSENSAVIRSRIEQLGRKEIFQHGHMWQEQGVASAKIFSSDLGRRLNSGSFSSKLLGLKPRTHYKIWPYVETVVGPVEGKSITFITD